MGDISSAIFVTVPIKKDGRERTERKDRKKGRTGGKGRKEGRKEGTYEKEESQSKE
jgi:hypothetical protein